MTFSVHRSEVPAPGEEPRAFVSWICLTNCLGVWLVGMRLLYESPYLISIVVPSTIFISLFFVICIFRCLKKRKVGHRLLKFRPRRNQTAKYSKLNQGSVTEENIKLEEDNITSEKQVNIGVCLVDEVLKRVASKQDKNHQSSFQQDGTMRKKSKTAQNCSNKRTAKRQKSTESTGSNKQKSKSKLSPKKFLCGVSGADFDDENEEPFVKKSSDPETKGQDTVVVGSLNTAFDVRTCSRFAVSNKSHNESIQTVQMDKSEDGTVLNADLVNCNSGIKNHKQSKAMIPTVKQRNTELSKPTTVDLQNKSIIEDEVHKFFSVEQKRAQSSKNDHYPEKNAFSKYDPVGGTLLSARQEKTYSLGSHVPSTIFKEKEYNEMTLSSNADIKTSDYNSDRVSQQRQNQADFEEYSIERLSDKTSDNRAVVDSNSAQCATKGGLWGSVPNDNDTLLQSESKSGISKALEPYVDHDELSIASSNSRMTRSQYLKYIMDKVKKEENKKLEQATDSKFDYDDSVNDPTSILRTTTPEQNVDSSPANVKMRVKSVNDPIPIDEYAAQEWKGDTVKADKIRRGYEAVQSETGYVCIRRIRGDNYCALRAVLFKVLSCGIDITLKHCEDVHITELPYILLDEGCTWIRKWSFANRISLVNDSVMETLVDCLEHLKDSVDRSCLCNVDAERYAIALDLMNGCEEMEIKLFEAVKFLMLYSSVRLYNSMQNGDDSSVLAMLLFARDTSENPECFMMNHLNHVGESGGVDQLEMMLLGYTLNIIIKVIRLNQVDEADFIARFPDDSAGTFDEEIFIVAEDDRHYNVLSEEL